MTLTSIVKLSTAVVFGASAALAGAQTSTTTTTTTTETTPSGTTVVTPAYGTGTDMTTAGRPAYDGAPSESMAHRTIGNMQAACAGLSDRQTERACKQDRNDRIVDHNPSKIGNDAGNADDQAD